MPAPFPFQIDTGPGPRGGDGSWLPGPLVSLGACLVGCLIGCQTGQPPAPRVEHWQAIDDMEYLEVVPRGLGERTRLPMVVFLHGMGDLPRAEWIADDAPGARYILPRAPAPYGQGFSWFPYRVSDGNPDLPRQVEGALSELSALLRVLLRSKPTVGRIVLSGFSQGGILSFGVALRHPELVELAHPVAGFLPEPLWPLSPKPHVRPAPIRAAHGTADPIVPLAPTQRMVAVLARRGFDIELETFEGVGHAVSAPMRELTESLILQGIESAIQ